jgi:hypothetical protein
MEPYAKATEIRYPEGMDEKELKISLNRRAKLLDIER